MIPIRLSDIYQNSSDFSSEEILLPNDLLENSIDRRGYYITETIISLEHRNIDNPFHIWVQPTKDLSKDNSNYFTKLIINQIEITSGKISTSKKSENNWRYLGKYEFSPSASNTNHICIESSFSVQSLYLTNTSSTPPKNYEQFEYRNFGFCRSEIGQSELVPSTVEVASEQDFTLKWTVGKTSVGKEGSLVIGIPWGIIPPPKWKGARKDKSYVNATQDSHWKITDRDCILKDISPQVDLQFKLLPFKTYSFKTREYLVKIKPSIPLTQGDNISIEFSGKDSSMLEIMQCFPYHYKQTQKIHWYTPTVPFRVLVDPKGKGIYASLPVRDSHSLNITPKDEEKQIFAFFQSFASEEPQLSCAFTTDSARNKKRDVISCRERNTLSLDSDKCRTTKPNDYIVKWPYYSDDNLLHSKKLANPVIDSKSISPYKVFWGDIHGHCELDDALGSPTEYLKYGRDTACLDFCAITCHGEYLTNSSWHEIQNLINEFNLPGEFVTFNAFEWTALSGHKNIYTPREDLPIVRSTDRPVNGSNTNFEKTFNQSEEENSLLEIPHHTLDGYDEKEFHLGKRELIEIYSMWGSSESRNNPLWDKPQPGSSVREILNQGAKLGFTAGSDTHDGRPGFSSNVEGVKSRYANLTYKNGIFAVLAKNLSRKSIFNALLNRRTFATTGKRILLLMRANRDNWMGSEMNEDNLKLDVFIAGTDIIEKVEIIKDGIVSNVYKPNQKYWSELLEPDFERWRYIYLKATQVDGEIAWSSPVFHC